jgi:hypothetical protein
MAEAEQAARHEEAQRVGRRGSGQQHQRNPHAETGMEPDHPRSQGLHEQVRGEEPQGDPMPMAIVSTRAGSTRAAGSLRAQR